MAFPYLTHGESNTTYCWVHTQAALTVYKTKLKTKMKLTDKIYLWDFGMSFQSGEDCLREKLYLRCNLPIQSTSFMAWWPLTDTGLHLFLYFCVP